MNKYICRVFRKLQTLAAPLSGQALQGSAKYLIIKIQNYIYSVMKIEYIYLLQEREFVKTNEHIFKIGKTKQENNKRFLQYPKRSILLLQSSCNDCDILEKKIIKLFKQKYIHKKDIGNEYFEGNYKLMKKDIHKNIKEEDFKEIYNKTIEKRNNYL